MINSEIYKSALTLIGQSVSLSDTEDYEERAPYLLASFCNEVCEIDRAARRALGLEDTPSFNRVFLSLDSDFPLLDKFIAVAAKYIAAMLIIDENGDLSDTLFHMYCEGIERIRSEIPFILEGIANKYL